MKVRLIALIALSSLFSHETARASSPSLGVITPRGGQRGTDTTIFFNGARLSDAQEILVYYPGITVTKLEVVKDNQIKADIEIAPDCRLGEHCMRVRTATGLSEMQTFFVGALPNVDEKEDNGDFNAPQKIDLNVTVAGIVQSEDVDYFAFEVKKGQRVTAEIEAMRLGAAVFDPYVAILDSKRFELAASDDAALLNQDAVASVVVPEDGTYVVEVRETSYGGNGSCSYRLHVGTFPRPTAVFPAGGKLGEEIELKFLGDVAGETNHKVKLPDQADPLFGINPEDEHGVAPSALAFRLSDVGNVIEVEPNNNLQQPTPAELPNALNGVIEKPDDFDYFKFTAKKGQTFDIRCYARRLRSPLDPIINIYDAAGKTLAGNDDSGGPDSNLRYTFPADGDYHIAVWDHLRKGGPTYVYRIEFEPVKPTLSVTIPKVDIYGYSQERQTIPVPRGNRYATIISASRSNFGGPVSLGMEDFPQGITMHNEDMADNLSVVPVVFEAAPDAPIGGALANIKARHADEKQNINGGFDQSVILVAVPNLGIYWRHELDRVAAAVTEEVPFKINVVEPKAPLVQNGSMNLKVTVERKEGFKAPIAVYPLFNPPGVGTGSATIPEGQNEIVLPVNANGGAQVRQWKTAVIAQSDCGKGPVWVSSQLFTLEIAAPFVSFTLERTAVEQGKEVDLFCKVQQNTPFEGNAKVNLIGLPPNVTTTPMDITKDTKEFAFKLKTTGAAPAGVHKNLFCQVYVTQHGEPVLHNQGSTELRIDPPPPVKKDEPKVAEAPKPKAPTEKRLTRLEKLRLEQKQREQAAGEGQN